MKEKYPVLIENEGALFRSFARSWPQEIWDFEEKKWVPYAYADAPDPKPVDWGTVLTKEEFEELRDLYAANR